jgi:peptide/nickel transport system permease protein
VVTIIGIGFALLIGGAVVTESVFALPGARPAHGGRDRPARLSGDPGRDPDRLRRLRLINLAVDVLYVVLDPRIRY